MDQELINQYSILHAKNKGYGRAATYLGKIIGLCKSFDLKNALDFGCGKGLLADKLSDAGIPCGKYDPAIEAYSKRPLFPSDLVVCNDVLEHLTIETYQEVLEQIAFSADKAIFFNVSCRPAVHKLPDGRNCHTLVQDHHWWEAQLNRCLVGFELVVSEYSPKNKNCLFFYLKK